MASALRTLYSTKKSKVRLGFVGERWEQRTVAELESSLNKWLASVPAHCKLRPSSLFIVSILYPIELILYT